MASNKGILSSVPHALSMWQKSLTTLVLSMKCLWPKSLLCKSHLDIGYCPVNNGDITHDSLGDLE